MDTQQNAPDIDMDSRTPVVFTRKSNGRNYRVIPRSSETVLSDMDKAILRSAILATHDTAVFGKLGEPWRVLVKVPQVVQIFLQLLDDAQEIGFPMCQPTQRGVDLMDAPVNEETVSEIAQMMWQAITALDAEVNGTLVDPETGEAPAVVKADSATAGAETGAGQ